MKVLQKQRLPTDVMELVDISEPDANRLLHAIVRLFETSSGFIAPARNYRLAGVES